MPHAPAATSFGMALRLGLVSLALGIAACSRSSTLEPTASTTLASSGTPHVSDPIALPAGPQAWGLFTWAAGPAGYLLVSSIALDVNNLAVFGTRLALDGTKLDPTPVSLGTFPTYFDGSSTAAVVHTGTHWLVACNGAVIAVENDGTVGTAVTLPSSLGRIQGLSWGSDRALLTTGSGQGLFLDGNGSAIGSVFSIFASTNQGGPVTFDGSVFFVTETRSPATEVLHTVTSAGAQNSQTFFARSGSGVSAGLASIVSDGVSVLATFMGSPPGCSGLLSCLSLVTYHQIATAAADGTITLGASWQSTTDPLATALGAEYLLWGAGSSERRDSAGALVSGPTASPNVSTGQTLVPELDSSELLALTAAAGTAQRLDPNLNLLDASPTTLTRPFDAEHPSAAFDGNDYLVAWESQIQTNENQAIGAARIAPAGSLLDSTPLPVTATPSNVPLASSNGAGFLLDWQTPDLIGMSSVSASGAVSSIDLSSVVSAYAGNPTLASDGHAYLATWAEPTVNGPLLRRAAIFSAAGNTAGPIDLGLIQPTPASTFDGQNYVLVWTIKNGTSRDVYALRLSPALDLLDTTPTLVFSYPASSTDTTPALASDGERTLIVWLEDDLTTIHCARIEHDLSLVDPGGNVVASATLASVSPRVAWDGAAYWIAWSDQSPAAAWRYLIHARRLDASLVPLDDQPFTVTDDGYWAKVVDDPSFAFAPGPAGQLLITYTADDRLLGHAVAVRARVLSTESQAGTGGVGAGGVGAGGVGTGTGGVGAGGVGAGTGGVGMGGADVAGGAGSGGAHLGTAGQSSGGGPGAGGNGEGGAAETAGESGAPSETGGTSASSAGGGTGGLSTSGGQGGTSGAPESLGGRAGSSSSTGGTLSAAGMSGSAQSAGRAGGGGNSARAGRSGAGGPSSAGASGRGSPPPSDSGCGCTVPSSHRTQGAWLAVAPLLLGLRRRRKQRDVTR